MAMTPRVLDTYWREPVKASDWKAMVQFGLWGVIHKASQGVNFKDKNYAARKQQALDAGLMWGAYHFADGRDARDQLDNFLNCVKPDKNTCLVLDWEDNPGGTKMTATQAKQFLGDCFMLTGQRPALYGGNTLKELIKDDFEFWSQHRLWLCQYGPKAVLPKAWKRYWLWQYTGDGIGMQPQDIPGTKLTDMDLNVYQGTLEDFRREWTGFADAKAVNEAPVLIKTVTEPVPVLEAHETPKAKPAPAKPAKKAPSKPKRSEDSWVKGVFED